MQKKKQKISVTAEEFRIWGGEMTVLENSKEVQEMDEVNCVEPMKYLLIEGYSKDRLREKIREHRKRVREETLRKVVDINYPDWFKYLDTENKDIWRIEVLEGRAGTLVHEDPVYYTGTEKGAMSLAFLIANETHTPFNKHHIFVTKEEE